jgi:hypothetical protein
MKERPILFSGPMVRAILEGRKTQTRRVIKPDWRFDTMTRSVWDYLDEGSELDMAKAVHYCPHGRRGDLIWVRETFCPDWTDHPIYQADGGSAVDAGYKSEPKWRPSIHMPRSACRLVLTIEHVRPERLQSISHHDIEQEGVIAVHPPAPIGEFSALQMFQATWDALNDKRGYGWDTNPWVWRICFRVQESRQHEPKRT